MNNLIIFCAVLAGGFLGLLIGAALLFTKDRGGCEECGKGCETINIYCGDDCEITLHDSGLEVNDDFDNDESESEPDSESIESYD